MKLKEAMFANFILKFGENDLLDYFKEIVIGAFTDDSLVSNRRGSSFYFLDVELVELTSGQGNWAIAGRLVQDTVLRRTQVYREGQGLVHDEATLQSCPSSFFVLTLSDHRLIYFAETAYAPAIASFKATVAAFLKRKHLAFLDREQATSVIDGNEPISRRQAAEAHPAPSLSIIPLTNKEGIEDFLARYSLIRKVEIVVHKPNREIDASDAVANIQSLRKQLGSEKAKLSLSESDGLDHGGTKEVLEDITNSPNTDTTVSGLDQAGDKLEGSNEDFSVRAEVDLAQLETPNMARRLFAKMEELRARGVLRLPDPRPEIRRRLQQIVDGLQ